MDRGVGGLRLSETADTTPDPMSSGQSHATRSGPPRARAALDRRAHHAPSGGPHPHRRPLPRHAGPAQVPCHTGVIREDSAPRLEWWTGQNAWLGEETDRPALHAVGDTGITGPVDITLRTDTPDDGRPVLSVGRTSVSPAPAASGSARPILTEPVATLRILTIGEYVEVYADNVFALTTLCYSRHSAPWAAETEGHNRTIPLSPIRPHDCLTATATTPRPSGPGLE